MKTIVFVADLFINEYIGGAELTTEAIVNKCAAKYKVIKKQCKELTKHFVLQNKDAKFVICNFSSLSDEKKILLCKNVNYHIIEYDYKFCKYRSQEKHYAIEGKHCECIKGGKGKINKIFYGYANKIWFMSKKQKNIFLKNVSTIKEKKCEVLSSVFSDGDLRFIESIKNNKKNQKYLILNSNSWIKNTKGCVEYAKDNNMSYELIQGLPYHEMLIKMSTSRGLIFRPLGGDTCPRVVIEAMMLGCEVEANDNVQHKDESWFSNEEECYKYMSSRAKYFMENV